MENSPRNQHLHGKEKNRKLAIFVHGDIDDFGLDPFAFRIYMRIVRRAGTNGESFESIANMASGCKMGEGTVKRKLKYLIGLGAITKRSRPGRSTVYRPNLLWPPKSDRTQLASDLGIDLTDLGVALTDPGMDPTDPPPSSNLTHEVIPLSVSPTRSSTQAIPDNNSSSGLSFVGEIRSKTTNVTTVVQAEEISGNAVSNLGVEKFSASPLNWEAAAERLGVRTRDLALRRVVTDFPENVDDAIAVMKEMSSVGYEIRHPTRWLIAAIRDGYKPEQRQPSIPPIPMDESQVPPYATPEYYEWLEKRTAQASWRRGDPPTVGRV